MAQDSRPFLRLTTDKHSSEMQALILTEEQSNESLEGWTEEQLNSKIKEYWDSHLSCSGVDCDAPEYKAWLTYFLNSGLEYGAVHAWVKGLVACPLRFLGQSTDPRYGLRPDYFDNKCEIQPGSDLAKFKEPELDARGYVILRPGMNYARRIWDIFANRVIPESWVPQASIDPITHAWVQQSEMECIWTPINQRLWSVPMPRDASLETVRQHLLAFGVQYTWLDVLCLRQAIPHDFVKETGGESEWQAREQRRLKEWESDVPLIGGIYLDSRKVIAYFNGLGRPFSHEGWLSERHWIRRAWTLQEIVHRDNMLIAGIGSQYDIETLFKLEVEIVFRGAPRKFTIRDALTQNLPVRDSILSMQQMGARCASNPLDKVAGLFFILAATRVWGGTYQHGGLRVPRYLPHMSPAEAWSELVHAIADIKAQDKNLSLDLITHSLLRDFPYPSSDHWFPSWEQAIKFPHLFPEEQIEDRVPPKGEYLLGLTRGRIYRGCKLRRNPNLKSRNPPSQYKYILSYLAWNQDTLPSTEDTSVSGAVSEKDKCKLIEVEVGSWTNIEIPEFDSPSSQDQEYVVVDVTAPRSTPANIIDDQGRNDGRTHEKVPHILIICRDITKWRPYQARSERVYLRRVTTLTCEIEQKRVEREHQWLPAAQDSEWGTKNDLAAWVGSRAGGGSQWIRAREVYLQ